MKPSLRILLVAVLSTFLIVLSGAIAAQATDAEEETKTTVAEATQMDSGGAAVEVPPVEEADEALPWTARFMYPLLVGGTLLLLVFIVVYYFARIKGRYEVVKS